METPFLPLTAGVVPGTKWAHRVVDLGELQVPSGRIEACDPFVTLGEGLHFEVPAGTYPVRMTVADVSDEQDGSHLREAYLSVVLAPGEPVNSEILVPLGEPAPPADEYYGVGVDAGTVGFVDAAAVATGMPPSQQWYDEIFDNGTEDSWFALMDSESHLTAGAANIVLPKAVGGENVVLCHSGWGDGFYPVVGSYDAAGTLISLHIDLQVDEPA